MAASASLLVGVEDRRQFGCGDVWRNGARGGCIICEKGKNDGEITSWQCRKGRKLSGKLPSSFRRFQPVEFFGGVFERGITERVEIAAVHACDAGRAPQSTVSAQVSDTEIVVPAAFGFDGDELHPFAVEFCAGMRREKHVFCQRCVEGGTFNAASRSGSARLPIA